MLREDGTNLVSLLGNHVEAAVRPQQSPGLFDKQAGDTALRIIWRIGQHDVERTGLQFLHVRRSDCFKIGDCIEPGIVSRQGNGSEITVNENNAAAWPGPSGREDAVRAVATTHVKNAVSILNVHGFRKGAGAVVKTAIREHTGA